ncbi:MAG: class I SAM-dependent methyltransferase [Gammaproteobacteria bacterium]
MDKFEKFKAGAKEAWSTFQPFESITGTAAPHLVRFAKITAGHNVLDVGSGTGVVALTASRTGAKVTGSDLSPQLVEHARRNAELAGLKIPFHEADVENLPFKDAEFDVVVSQFGHMFGPQADKTLGEMLRVLKPGGTIAFSTWPPEVYTGRMFKLMAKYSPPPPEGLDPPVLWGHPDIVTERFAGKATDVTFNRATMFFPTLSPTHLRLFMEANVGPMEKLVESLKNEPEKLAALRGEFEALAATYFEDNVLRQDFLMSRAIKL